MGPVVVDGCASCHGVFLDHGEFERLRRGRAPVRERGWSQRSKPVEERTGIDVSNLDGVLYELFG